MVEQSTDVLILSDDSADNSSEEELYSDSIASNASNDSVDAKKLI